MALNAAPGTTALGETTTGAPAAPANGSFPLAGPAGTTTGANPANQGLIDSTGSAVAPNNVFLTNYAPAYNTPSWLLNNRPLIPGAPPSDNQFPLGFFQEASTPVGLRNFVFGPNTGTHFDRSTVTNVIRIGREPRGPTMAGIELPAETIEPSLVSDVRPQSPAEQALRAGAMTKVMSEVAEHAPTHVLDAVAESPPITSGLERPTAAQQLDETAIDSVMAQTGSLDAALLASQMESATPSDDASGAKGAAHALVASLAAPMILNTGLQPLTAKNTTSIHVKG